jgi:glutathione S-transferase
MALIVYGGSLSPFVRKVLIVLAEKGVEATNDPVNPFAPPPEFIEISPMKRIPVLRDTDVPEPNTIPDSSAICDYLENKYPNPPLYPKDAFQRARALWYEEYADSLVAVTIGPGLFFERVVKKMMKQETNEELCKKTMHEKLPPVLDHLEKELGDREYFVGNAFSIADVSVGTMFVNLEFAGETVDASRWPKLAAYIKRIHARPSFQANTVKEAAFVKRVLAA